MSSPPVVIDARAAMRAEVGGVERVAREMAERLPSLHPGRYRVAAPRPALAHRAGHAWEQLVLPAAARDAEIVYCPANLAPLASRRTVIVVHDAAPLRHPEFYSRAYVRWQRALLPRLARRAQLVITPSEFARAEVTELLGVPGERVLAIPNGVDPARFNPGADAPAAAQAMGLTRPYVLVVGTRIARKNLATLGPAAARLAAEGIELVAAGSGRGYMHAEDDVPVRALGYVPERLLPGLYAGARALAMPSVYEGFGLPCIEAMAAGVPVVAARRAALPETCGGAALLVDPDDGPEVAAALMDAATADHTRARLTAAGLERAAGLSWARTAERTDAALGGLLEGGRPSGTAG